MTQPDCYGDSPNGYGAPPLGDEEMAGRFLRSLPVAALATCLLFSFMNFNSWPEAPAAPLVITLLEFTPVRPEAQFIKKSPPVPKKPQLEKPRLLKRLKVRPIAAKAPLAVADRPKAPTVQVAEIVKDAKEPEEMEPPSPVYHFTQLDEIPEVLYQVDPEYPIAARRAGTEGRIVVKALVEPDGSVGETSILKSMAEAGFDQAALEAIRQWRFSAPRIQGQPVRVWMVIPIHFKLYD